MTKPSSSSPLTLKNKLRILFVSSRPVSWINTAFPFAAGYIVSGGEINGLYWLSTFYFLVPYNILIYVVNDVYDYESDKNNPRKNSIEGGLVPPSVHRFMLLTAYLVGVPFLIIMACGASASANLILLACVIMAAIYSAPPRFKEIPVLDSVTSSFHFVSPLIYTLVLTGWQASYWPYIIAFFLWGMASHAFGAIQDINSDKKAKISSIATVFGASLTCRLSFLFYFLAGLLMIFQGGIVVIAGLALWVYLLMVAPFLNLKNSEAEKANRGWRFFLKINQLTGFIVTLVIIVSLM